MSIPIYIGYDPREAVAYHVCVQSIIENCSKPEELEFHPIWGERRDGSNDFIYARFLVPWRQAYRGHAIFMDGDMIVRGDICQLWESRSEYDGVQVVQHNYKTKHPIKYFGNKNEDYERKNWSSVIVWNCGFYPNRILTPELVAGVEGSFLHQFKWLDDKQIGELPDTWNRLVMEQPVSDDDKLLHYTIALPCFPQYKDCDHASEWWETYKRATAPL